MRWDDGEFDFEAMPDGRRGGHRALDLHRERDHGGQPAARRVGPDQEEDPVDGRRLQDGDGARRRHLRDLAEADRVEPPAAWSTAPGRSPIWRARRVAPTSTSPGSSTGCSRRACSEFTGDDEVERLRAEKRERNAVAAAARVERQVVADVVSSRGSCSPVRISAKRQRARSRWCSAGSFPVRMSRTPRCSKR